MIEVQEALMAVDGVAEATVEEADGTPVGVRVELESGADERSVASGVQSVLSSYGLRSRLAPPRSKLEPVMPPPPPTVLPIRPPPAEPESVEEGVENSVHDHPGFQVSPGVAQVTLTQGDDGVVVAVTAGSSIQLLSRAGDDAVTQSIVGAVSELVDPQRPPPRIISVEYQESPGAEVVTVVLEVGGGELKAAAQIVTAGRELAIARAAWKALTSDS